MLPMNLPPPPLPPPLPHIVVVDDDPDICQIISDYLTLNDLRVTTVCSGQQLKEVLERESIDLVVLDLRLPGEDGMQIARSLRENSSLPIIILTGRVDEADRVMGLELGADDYLTKPFSSRELLARIRALLRRTQARATVADELAKLRAFRFNGWELNVGLRKLKSPGGQLIALSKGEFSLLAAFLSSPRQILTRDQLLDLSRLHNDEVYDRSIDVQILRLRRKIEENPAKPAFIVTERGAGYVFNASVELVR